MGTAFVQDSLGPELENLTLAGGGRVLQTQTKRP